MKILTFTFVLFGLQFLTSWPDTAIVGKWMAPAMENSVVQIYQSSDGFFYGKIVDSDQKDWIGEIVLTALHYDAGEKIWKGEVYSLSRQMTAATELSLESDNRLKVVGTKFYVSKTYFWTKV